MDPTMSTAPRLRLQAMFFLAALAFTAASTSTALADFIPFPTVGSGALRLRLEADSGVTFGSGSAVAGWAAQSGNSFNAAQGTATLRRNGVPNASANGLFPSARCDCARP